MSNLDLVLKNGIVFLPQGRTSADVGIKNGKITEIGNCGDANKVIDCTNLFIFPGLIDTLNVISESQAESIKKQYKQAQWQQHLGVLLESLKCQILTLLLRHPKL